MGSSNKYGTLISFTPAVAVGRGAFFVVLSCLSVHSVSTSSTFDLLLLTLSLAPKQTSRLLVPVTGRDLGSK
jgi:hypothetical protein